MLDVQVRHPVAPADVELLRSLADAAARVDHHPSLGDAVWRDLADPAPSSRLLFARADGALVGALHATAGGPATVTASLVVEARHHAQSPIPALLDALVADARTRGNVRVSVWALGAGPEHDMLAERAGFSVERELWQMQVPLPLDEDEAWPAGITVRCFEPGRDEDAWIAVNNRAFRADPDQGGWTTATLVARESEEWFDPRGFLLAVDSAGIVGFCWTKIHPAAPPDAPDALGEIYVIGVDPDHQGRGLGRTLVTEGLASLHRRGVEIGMLFVDAVNTAGVGLYRALGFEVTRVDRAYGRNI